VHFYVGCKTDGSLKGKRRTLIITNYDASTNSKDEIKGKDQVFSNHITIQEADDLEIELKLAEAPKTLKDGGQAIVDELKELNLRTKEDPRPTYVGTMLTPEKEKAYICLELQGNVWFRSQGYSSQFGH